MNDQNIGAGGDVHLVTDAGQLKSDQLLIVAGSGVPAGSIRFEIPGRAEPVLRFAPNGDIFVHGRLVETDLETVTAFKSWLAQSTVLR